ncbi:bifunctional demethylmenaquinone methyltransferase/2-methoxy-6-polyprenyl-1,4-benzoquinol methylase UbiE [Calycomorphotria hydatis]|uniref:Demethylmenaquinone methyltransferase n=1 Tax=Calycomorphotria hydatis TaxID=2528027 RepID=A0A517T458_9PLAN|nr:bifunctional demethylmenaquinone methyltransferase/2-methoxy-6-polyprenyl-1,4-benzoquinol methylase UbiE [Calycomorphotria hydatis]QDT63163.1 UbiE/COQ5 methyltransferase [Calycomorphotria hydatis]
MGVDKSGERVQQMFGEIAPRYDLNNHLLSGGVDYYWRWLTVSKARKLLSGDAPILDVCTGTGDLAFAFANAFPQIPVIGSDFTHEMLVIAEQKQAKQQAAGKFKNSTPIPFLKADTQELPFSENTFQIVSVAFGLRNVSDTLRGLKEMARVTTPGGWVMVLEFSMPRNVVIGPLYRWYFRNVLPLIGQLVARNQQSAYNYLPESVGEFPDYERLGAIFEEAGLKNVSWTPLTFRIATLYVGQK